MTSIISKTVNTVGELSLITVLSEETVDMWKEYILKKRINVLHIKGSKIMLTNTSFVL